MSAATASTIASPWSAPISSSATPPGSSTAGSRSTRRRMTSSPSGPPSSAAAGSKARPGASVGEVAGRDVRQVGADQGIRVVAHGQQVGLAEQHPVGDPVADRVLAGQVERVRPQVHRDQRHVRRPCAASAGPRGARRRSPPSPSRRRRSGAAARPGGRGSAVRRATTNAIASSTSSSVSGRGMRARRSVAIASPWNSRKPRM